MLNLKPSQTVYHKWGKHGKRIVLRFSKSGDQNLEAAYSRHYIANMRGQSCEDLVATFQALATISSVTLRG